MPLKLNNLLQKEITRKEFLSYLGLMLLSVFGITSALKSIAEIGKPGIQTSAKKTSFGSGAYGE